MDRTDKVSVKGVDVAPRDVLAAITPDPISLGDKFRGRAVVGTWVLGIKDGKPRETFAYQMADAEETWRRYGLQVVGWQTGFNPVMAMELLAEGAWTGAGVLGPEAFDPDPYLVAARPPRHPPRQGRDGARSAPPDLSAGLLDRRDALDCRVEPGPDLEKLAQGLARPCGVVVGRRRDRLLERPELERVVGEVALDLRPPGRDLRAPVRLGIGCGHLVGAQAPFEIDSGTPESRELGSDLAIGHAHILLMSARGQRPGAPRMLICPHEPQEADR